MHCFGRVENRGHGIRTQPGADAIVPFFARQQCPMLSLMRKRHERTHARSCYQKGQSKSSWPRPEEIRNQSQYQQAPGPEENISERSSSPGLGLLQELFYAVYLFTRSSANFHDPM